MENILRILSVRQRNLKLAGLAFLLLCAMSDSYAQWPVELRWSGVSLGYPKIGADGENGAFVAGSGLAFDGWDTFLFHVDSAGNSLWEVADSACYIGPGNQYPIALYPDGTGGCVALIDEEVLNFPEPSRNRVQIIRYDAEGHKVWQYMPYDTTWEMLHGFGAMAVTHGQVFVFWYSNVPDSVGDWHTRLRVSDGIAVDTPAIRRVSTRGIRQTIEKNDSLLLLAADTVLVQDPENGGITPYLYWGRLYTPQMLLRGDSILIAGRVSGNGLSPWVLRCLHGDTVRNDTIGQGFAGGSLILVPNENTILAHYSRTDDLYGRFYAPGLGFGDEFPISDAPDDQFYLKVVSGSEGLGLAWTDLAGGEYLYIQQYRDGVWRWQNGNQLASVETSPQPQYAVCGGADYGFVVHGDLGSVFYVQPIDSILSDSVALREPYVSSQFVLYDPFPNPFNGSVQIEFDLPREEHVTLNAYNILGELIAQIANDAYAAGTHRVTWQSDVASGIYLLSLRTSHEIQTRKLLLIR